MGKSVRCRELANMLRAYQKDKNTEIIPIHSGYKMMKPVENCEEKVDKINVSEQIKANSYIDEFDDGDLEDLCKDIDESQCFIYYIKPIFSQLNTNLKI